MKWNNEQLDILAEVYKSTLKPVVIHCEDWDDEIRVRKYMEENHPVVDFETMIGLDAMYEEFCCAEFAKHANRDDYKSGAFVKDGNGHWNITGCCGGGCFVVHDMYLCPFCGTELRGIKISMNILNAINNNAKHNEQRWINNKDSTEARRFLTLSAEVGELADAIKGKHEHTADVELIRIAGICLNWLRFYTNDMDLKKSLKVANHED